MLLLVTDLDRYLFWGVRRIISQNSMNYYLQAVNRHVLCIAHAELCRKCCRSLSPGACLDLTPLLVMSPPVCGTATATRWPPRLRLCSVSAGVIAVRAPTARVELSKAFTISDLHRPPDRRSQEKKYVRFYDCLSPATV